MLAFEEKTTRFLDDAYQGSDAARRRRACFELLDIKRGDKILDLGCGNGLLTLELSRAVGSEGSVVGIDPSVDMLDSAKTRCVGRQNIEFVEGSADSLKLGDHSIDKAVSLQVFEYFSDLHRPLNELKRVLRPNGKLVISDIHWDTLIWHTDHPERMAQILRVWDQNLSSVKFHSFYRQYWPNRDSTLNK